MGQTAYLELAYPVKILTAQTIKLNHRASRFAHTSRCAVDQQGCSPVGYYFRQMPLIKGGETGNFLSIQTFLKAALTACVISLAMFRKIEVLTRTLRRHRKLLGSLWLANCRCHNHYTSSALGSLLA